MTTSARALLAHQKPTPCARPHKQDKTNIAATAQHCAPAIKTNHRACARTLDCTTTTAHHAGWKHMLFATAEQTTPWARLKCPKLN
eukprot:15474766-Alexandrium_andersonii.AAC.1